ncbi:MAG TPA: NAD(P)/FAD-dependent oxidoreductase [Bacteroidales bacterium]|nr:NAD(P)/FAD-dependent oxidoreductase [Bacteroidales bacterium]
MSKKIVIIGGGVAGLSAGIYARLNGFDAEIVEMHSITGGQCTAWNRKGYRFDYCLHWLVGTRKGPFNDIWNETGVLDNNVKIIDHDVHTRVYNSEGKEFILYTDLSRWEEYLCGIAPEDSDRIRKMCRDMRKSSFLQPYADPPKMRNPFRSAVSMLKMAPVMGLFIKYGRMDCKTYFKKLGFTNKDLLLFFESMYGSRDFSALAFIMMFAWFNQKNAGYLIGGSLPMAERMTKRFRELGGILTTRSRVEKIIVEGNTAKGVILSGGKRINADYVISAADGYSTIFNMLEGKYLTKKITNAYKNWELFTPIVQVSFGINGKAESAVPVDSYLAKDQLIGSTKLGSGYSIMNYSFDPTMAPDGKTVLVLRFESEWENWKDMGPADYEKEKEKIEKDATALLEKHYPGITSNIETTDVATPITDVKYTGVWKGSYEGFMPSSKNLMDNISPFIPGLKNFYMAGQWLFPGGGLPPAAQSGKWAIQYICREQKKKFQVS